MIILLERWISYHTCPHCGGSETLHQYSMDNLDMGKYGNTYHMQLAKSNLNPNDIMLTKKDLCLTCGRDWVMYIQRVDTQGEDFELKIKEIGFEGNF